MSKVYTTALFLLWIVIGCQKTPTVSNANFQSFFNRFATDSTYQKKHIQFPLIINTYDDEGEKQLHHQLASDDWRYLDLKENPEHAKRSLDAYTQKARVTTDSTTVELRGVDNGIYTNYVFKKLKKDWMLVRIQEFSN
jgi:hypothetical protein